MATAQLTADEIVQSLRRSNLATVLVEGRDDMTVYRWIEEAGGYAQVDVFPCGGRPTLLEVFKRRSEFDHLPCAFVADKDMWLFSPVPCGHEELILTRGYSIENDLLCGSCVANLLTARERSEFNALLDILIHWFACEVEKCLRGEPYCVDLHPNQLIPPGTPILGEAALASHMPYPPEDLERRIRSNFELEFRGRSLVEVYTRILSARQRTSKFSRQNVLEMAAKLDGAVHTRRLYDEIMARIRT